MKATVQKVNLERGINIINSVIGNSLVNVDNKKLNILNIEDELHIVGFGLNRQISYKIGDLEESMDDGSIQYQIVPNEISKALPYIDVDKIEFILDNEDFIYLEAGDIELKLINTSDGMTDGELVDAIERIISFTDVFTFDATDFIKRLNLLDKMIVVGNSEDDDITVTNDYIYTNMNEVPIDTRLDYEGEQGDFRLDKSSIKTVLEMAKGEDLSDVSILVDDSTEEFTIGIGESKYILGDLDTYFMGKDEVYDAFESEGEIKVPYKDFIRYLKLATIYLDDLTEVYLTVKGNKMEVLPDTAYIGSNLGSNENTRQASYSKAELDVESDKDLTIVVTGDVIVKLLSNLTDIMDINDFSINYGDSSIKFNYEFGQTILGANIELGDD